VSIYDENKHKGRLRHLLIRTAYNTDETMVVLVTKGDQLPFKNQFIDQLSAIESVKSIVHNVNNQKGNRVLGYKNETIYGKDKIIDTIGDIKFEISPLSFYQINPIQTKKLYDQVKVYADLTGEEVVLDLFCGIGTIGLYLADKAKQVIGVEVVTPAVEDARKNASDNNINNIEFFNGKAEEVMPKLQKDGITADIIIVDPPRKGCDEKLLETIKTINPKKVIYVSCKPSTLARDLKYLSDQYQVVEVQPVDMFPQTTHIENIALLIRK
jgi:23S rRNA (uracil1939-C5)-methyltransferase